MNMVQKVNSEISAETTAEQRTNVEDISVSPSIANAPVGGSTVSNPVLEIIMSGPALKRLSEIYPPNRYGKVPLKIKMACTVKSDLPMFIQRKSGMVAEKGKEYFVWCNSHGAMSAILPNGERLGIRPSECEIIEWHS